MKILKEIYHTVSFLFLLYTAGLFVGLLFLFLRLIKRVRVENGRALKELKNGRMYGRNGVLIVSNHPSLLEPFLIPALFFPACLINPFKFFPWSTPDKHNFVSPWYLWPVRRFRSIPIQRREINMHDIKSSFFKIIERLRKGERVVIFPEGGRTHKRSQKIYSPIFKKEMGRLKNGAEKIIQTCRSVVLPVWIENTDKVLPPRRWIPNFCKSQIIVKIGDPIFRDATTEELEKILLGLADN